MQKRLISFNNLILLIIAVTILLLQHVFATVINNKLPLIEAIDPKAERFFDSKNNIDWFLMRTVFSDYYYCYSTDKTSQKVWADRLVRPLLTTDKYVIKGNSPTRLADALAQSRTLSQDAETPSQCRQLLKSVNVESPSSFKYVRQVSSGVPFRFITYSAYSTPKDRYKLVPARSVAIPRSPQDIFVSYDLSIIRFLFNLLLLFFLSYLPTCFAFYIRNSCRRTAGRCENCAYDINNVGSSRCPECGREIRAAQQPSIQVVSEHSAE